MVGSRRAEVIPDTRLEEGYMNDTTRIVGPGKREGWVHADGQEIAVPAEWVLVPPGDPGLTRRVKAAGPTWTVQEKMGRKTFSRGVWAPAVTVARIQAELEKERSTESYSKRRASDTARRQRQQVAYVGDFRQAVLDFLAFAPRHAALAEQLADAVARHATPVGSGTVARTERIPIAERAEAAVIAWLRHQTTGYDTMAIERRKGRRREVRRELAARSRELLARYRRDDQGQNSSAPCPLVAALAGGTDNALPPLPTLPANKKSPRILELPPDEPAA